MKLHPWSRETVTDREITPGPRQTFKQPTKPPGGALLCFIISVFFFILTLLPAFSVSYYTPTRGLGCRSGGYVVYFIAAFVSALLLAFSSLLTKHWYWHYLDTKAESKDTGHPIHHTPNQVYDLIKFSAVYTRILGKLIAYASSIWIILHCVFQSIGYYNRCWCNCDAPSMGTNGFWVFLDAQQLQSVVAPYWRGYTAESIIVMAVTTGILYLLSMKYRKRVK
jgi:hypothetical protein